MSDQARALLKNVEEMILEEAWIQRETIEKQWKLPLHERIRMGKAISGLCFSGVNDRNENLIFTCDENNSLFRAGDVLFFHKSNPLLEDPTTCFLESDYERYIEVSVSFKTQKEFGTMAFPSRASMKMN